MPKKAQGWVNQVNANPPLIGCGVNKQQLVPQGIREYGTFSLIVTRAECPTVLRSVIFLEFRDLHPRKRIRGREFPKADPEKAGAHSVIPVLHQKRNGSEEPPRASPFL
jgi:flavin reductase (DIM6/NTAB) family NADH-FMN oxidoreductase RutF